MPDTCRRIRSTAEARQFIGQEMTWFDPLSGAELHTDALLGVTGVNVLLGDQLRHPGHIWMEPAASFKDQRFAPERKGAWARIRSFLQSLTKL